MAVAIPLDIIAKILVCLPFESILNCKLVSKQWKDLINHPKFYSHYNTKSSLSLFFTNRYNLCCLLIRHDNNTNPGTVVGRRHPPFSVHRLPIDLAKHSNYGLLNHRLLSGSSNGIICVLLNSSEFLVYNLFNGVSYTVQDAPLPTGISGFGYDRYDNDYKIVVVVLKPTSVVWVYSLKNLVWTPHKGFPYAKDYSVHYGGSCSFNGVLHWVVIENKKKVIIMTYDLHTCRFGEMSVPDGYFISGSSWSYSLGLGELDGQLCYWDGLFKTDVWVMKEYGVRESWTPIICLEELNAPLLYRETPTGLYECRNGSKGVLFVTLYGEGCLYWCNIDNGDIEEVPQSKWGSGRKRRINKQDWGHIKKCFLG